MEYSFYDFLALLGSLALFLYGMKIMSEGLQKFAGDRLRNILTAMTTNRVTGVLTGTLITALVQSSSATTVMVLRLPPGLFRLWASKWTFPSLPFRSWLLASRFFSRKKARASLSASSSLVFLSCSWGLTC